MHHKISTTVILILALSPFTNGLFFGLFSSKPTPKPDVVVGESSEAATDKIAYENYLSSLASIYPSYPSIRYVPVYALQPQYTEYVQPQQTYIYSDAVYPSAPLKQVPVRYEYTQPAYTTSVKFQKPITVLPTESTHTILPPIPDVTQSLDKLIEARTTTTEPTKVSLEYGVPEPQMPTTLIDLPIAGIAPDFRTGGYATKTLTVSPSSSGTARSGRKFGHSYTHGDGTKVSEEGQLVDLGNGQETVVKRGQYEYIDAFGKPVLVKWVADDDGFRVVN